MSLYLGEALYVFIFYMILFIKDTTVTNIFYLIFASLISKYAITLILAIPINKITFLLKKAENYDAYDYKINYNPFKIS